MANTKSAIKATRKAARHAVRNKATLSSLKTLRKNYDQAASKGDAPAARTAGMAYASAVDKAVKKGVVHKNAANHVKHHVAKFAMAKV